MGIMEQKREIIINTIYIYTYILLLLYICIHSDKAP